MLHWGREDFFVTKSNEEALKWIDQFPNWPSFAFLLYGEAGCGKTHLSHVFALNVGAKINQGEVITRGLPAEILKDTKVMVMEDIHLLFQKQDSVIEEKILHFSIMQRRIIFFCYLPVLVRHQRGLLT